MDLTREQKILLNNFAQRSFRDIADQDYLTARLCFRNNLMFQFLWMSQQSIEKYIKGILLFNQVPVLDINHNLIKGLEKIKNIPYLDLDLSEKTLEFIIYVNDQGPNRYFQKVMYTRGFELITLDRAVWELRRFCRTINYDIKTPSGKTINMLELESKVISNSRNHPAHKHSLFDGYLEKRIRDNKYNQGDILIWKNFFFGKIKKNTIKMGRSVAWSSPTHFSHPESQEFLSKFVKLK
ncbi:HEPN domain-containing protein [Rahnella aceris]|uniref:HEPN domain-containing protein n=1 Tax=Rahnella sp. (strain Y9602) TaxID=2703885 RepID=UPI001F5374B8|nr:HEPN domain-containing protein [Rahnella aceris]UNK55616.1 HEPN domain-containing protein [Rahnella aceris]